MAILERRIVKPRPVYLNLLEIRQPLPAIVSILHRISGALLFLVGIPVLLWGVHVSVASPEAFAQWKSVMAQPLWKLVALALAWAYIHHCAISRLTCTSASSLRRRVALRRSSSFSRCC